MTQRVLPKVPLGSQLAPGDWCIPMTYEEWQDWWGEVEQGNGSTAMRLSIRRAGLGTS